MNLDLARRAQELLKLAMDRPADGRTALLAESCRDDQELRAEVESLLAAAGRAGTFLETPAIVAFPATNGHDPVEEMIGRRVGAFTIRSVIGHGGMGTVFLAQQDNPSRPVALKVLRTALLSRAALRRFEYESQILARLQHPNIAQVFEAGTSEIGPPGIGSTSPYFAMEHIADALPITSYADDRGLGERERIEVFLTTCQAVHFGHQKGIIHRDLKPPNILVNQSGLVKVIDFGVACASDADLAVTGTFSDAGQLVGTLPYMSPEQFLAGAADAKVGQGEPPATGIDVRTDVYSLGVVLYELLCGQPPYDVGRSSFYEAAQLIHQQPPLRPRHIRSTIGRDLETIILKALEKDRERRYQSVADLARDLQRYLNSQPIEARPPSLRYQARLFARRNRALVAGVSIALAAIIAGLITSIVFAAGQANAREHAETRRQEALRQARIAQAVNEFLNSDVLASADPFHSPRRDLTVRSALDNAADNIGDRFAEEPLVEASIRDTIGTAYLNLGEYDAADVHLTQGLALRRTALGERHLDTLASLHQMAWLRYHQQRYDEVEPLLMDALEQRQAVLGADHPDTLKSLSTLASLRLRQQRYDEAEVLHKQTLEARQRTLGDDHQLLLDSTDGLARVYAAQGRYIDALPLYEQVYEGSLRMLGADHRFSLYAMGNLARLYPKLGRQNEGERLLTESLEQARRILGDDHPDTLVYMTDLGALHGSLGRHAQAEALLEEAFEGSKRVHGEAHHNTIGCASHLASLRHKQRRFAEAQSIFEEFIELAIPTLGEDHQLTLGLHDGLALALDAQGRRDEALAIYEPLLERRRRLLGESHPDTLNSAHNLAFVYGNLGRHADSEAIFRQVLETRRRALGEDHHSVALALTNLGYVVGVQGRRDEAEQIMTEAVEAWRRSSSPRHPFAANAMGNLAGMMLRQGRPEQAEPLVREALTIHQETNGPPEAIASLMGLLGESLTAQQRFTEAEPLLLDSYERLRGGSAQSRQRALERMITLYDNSGRPEQAATWRAMLDDSSSK